MNKTLIGHPVTQLIANKQYYTFQLSCYIYPSSTANMSIDNTFSKTVLYIIDWLKNRITLNELIIDENTDLYKLFECPKTDCFKDFNVSDFSRLRVRGTFNIDILYLQDINNWSLHIYEADNHSEFKSKDNIIFGRYFDTDIAAKNEGDYISLSVRITCTEPILNTIDCKVYRPKFISLLSNDNSLIIRELLSQDIDFDVINNQPVVISTNSICNKFANDLVLNDKRQLPVLMFTHDSSSIKDFIDINYITNKLVAFAHVAVILPSQFLRLFKARLKNDDIEPGDIVIYTNSMDYLVYDRSSIDHVTQNEIVSLITNYPIRKNVTFNRNLFYKESKVYLYSNSEPLEKIDNKSKDYFSNLLKEKDNEILKILADINALQNENRTLNKSLNDADRDLNEAHIAMLVDSATIRLLEEKISSIKNDLTTSQLIIQQVLSVPTNINDIIDWIEKNFSEQIIVHDKAKSTMSRPRSQFNIRSLCSCIIYLNAYMFYKRKKISQKDLELFDMRNNWTISSCGNRNITRFPEYQILVKKANGNIEKEHLIFHVRSGSNPKHLFRIYFYIDEPLDKLVIGGMPDHFRTIQGY